MTKSELINLVRRVVEADGTESELDEYIQLVSRSVPHPRWTDLMYYNTRELTPEEVVEEALAYRPTQL